jgi:FkbM family methyltransferase
MNGDEDLPAGPRHWRADEPRCDCSRAACASEAVEQDRRNDDLPVPRAPTFESKARKQRGPRMPPGIGQPHPLRRQINASLSRYFVAGERAGDLVLRSPIGFEFDGRAEWIPTMLERDDVHDEDYRMFRTLTEADGVFLDIGANYGYSAASVWATGATCAVISFEPIPAFEPCLEVIARLRPGRYDYRIIGLGSDVGKITFVTPVVNAVAVSALTTAADSPDLESMATNIESYIANHMAATQDVSLRFYEFEAPIETLDSALTRGSFRVRSDRIAAIKIDTEGLEFQVLKGATETLRSHRPMVMLERGNRTPGIQLLMAELGYFYAERDDMVLHPFAGMGRGSNGFFLHRHRAPEYHAAGLLLGGLRWRLHHYLKRPLLTAARKLRAPTDKC